MLYILFASPALIFSFTTTLRIWILVSIPVLHNATYWAVFNKASVRQCKEWVIEKKWRIKCRRCNRNANSYSLICKTPRWHLPDSRAADKNRAFILLWLSITRVSLLLLVLSVFPLESAPIAPPFVLSCLPESPLCSSVTSPDQLHCRRRRFPCARHVPDKWRSRLLPQRGACSSWGAKSPPLIAQLQRTDKRPWSLILLKMDYQPLCILLHPSRSFFLPFLYHFNTLAVLVFGLIGWMANPHHVLMLGFCLQWNYGF